MQYPVRQARWVIVLSFLLLSMRVDHPPVASEPEEIIVPEHVVQKIKQRQLANARYAAWREQQEELMWLAFVHEVGERTGIRDQALAERVAHSIEDALYDYENLRPRLLTSLIYVESSGNPDAVSSVGAIGLTQVMPATGREIASELGVEWTGAEMLRHPETSVRFGAHYLDKLITRFDGDERAALAAYNWGPTHIAGRIARDEELPTVYPDKVLSRLANRAKSFFGGLFGN